MWLAPASAVQPLFEKICIQSGTSKTKSEPRPTAARWLAGCVRALLEKVRSDTTLNTQPVFTGRRRECEECLPSEPMPWVMALIKRCLGLPFKPSSRTDKCWDEWEEVDWTNDRSVTPDSCKVRSFFFYKTNFKGLIQDFVLSLSAIMSNKIDMWRSRDGGMRGARVQILCFGLHAGLWHWKELCIATLKTQCVKFF